MNKVSVIFLLALTGWLAQSTVRAQFDPLEPTVSASPQPTVSPLAVQTPIPYSDIIAQSEQASATLTEIASSTTANPTADAVERELPALSEEINALLQETAKIVASRTSFDRLRNFETEWRSLTKKLPQWKTDLTERARKLEANLTQINDLEKKWRLTAGEPTDSQTPPEILSQIQNVLTAVADVRRQIEAQQARVIILQNRTAEEQRRVDGAIASLRQTREALFGQLLVRDSPPIWSREFWAQMHSGIWQDTAASLAAQVTTLKDFAVRNSSRIVFHLFIFLGFAGLLLFLQRKARPWVEKDAALKNAAVVFDLPISTALILAILFNTQIYPQTPQILGAIFGAIAIVPTVIILRKLVPRPLYPILYSLVVFYFFDLLRTVLDSQEILGRFLFLLELFGGTAFFLWLYRTRLSNDPTDQAGSDRIFRTFRLTAVIALPIFAAAFAANLLGYVSLSQLLGDTALRSGYAALLLYGFVRITDGLVIFALRFRPLCYLKMVEQHRDLIQRKIQRFLRFLAVCAWIIIPLEFLTLREPLFEALQRILTARLSLGSLNISLGDIMLFVITVWAAFLLSRFLRFALEEDIYPRFALERGLPYAISTLLNYTILFFGFLLAVAAAGFDLSKFTLLAGAFGVGIGFGLQNIINNFVSGLILLFERPIKVGDLVKIGDANGTIRRIGIRASVVHNWDDSDIIVPNSKLISDNVTNWTLVNQRRGVEVVLSLPPDPQAEPSKIIEIMEKAAANHPLVRDQPAPQVLFDEILFDRLTFKLRIWTDYFDKVLKIRSDLVLNISQMLQAENIQSAQIDSGQPSA